MSHTKSDRAEILKISGRKIELDASTQKAQAKLLKVERRPGGFFLITHPEGHQERVHGLAWGAGGAKLTANLSGVLYHGERIVPERGGGSSGGGAGDSDLTAQFPGKVRKVLIKEGAVVEDGQPLLLLEAMKMEFAIKAPSGGQVLKVLVQEGQILSPGMQLIEFEASPSSPDSSEVALGASGEVSESGAVSHDREAPKPGAKRNRS